jgi:hypothetical protein
LLDTSIGVSPPRFEDLFEQADVLVARGDQADLRRAISTAYYGLFHFALTEAADLVVGKDDRSSARYSLVVARGDCPQSGRRFRANIRTTLATDARIDVCLMFVCCLFERCQQ